MLYLLIMYNTSMYVLSCFQMLEHVCALRWCLLFDALINTDTKSHGVLVPMCCLPQRAGTRVLCCMKDRSQLQCLIFTWGWTPTMVITLLIQSTRQSVPQDFIVWVDSCRRRNRCSQETWFVPSHAEKRSVKDRKQLLTPAPVLCLLSEPTKAPTPGWISFGMSYLTNSCELKWQRAFLWLIMVLSFPYSCKTLSIFSVWDFMEILLVKCYTCEKVKWGQNTGDRSESLIFAAACNL